MANLWEAEYSIDKRLTSDLNGSLSPESVRNAYLRGVASWKEDMEKQLPVIEKEMKLDKAGCDALQKSQREWLVYANKMTDFVAMAMKSGGSKASATIKSTNLASEEFFVFKYRWIWQLHMAYGRYPFDSFVEVNSRKEEENRSAMVQAKALQRLSANKPGFGELKKSLIDCDDAWKKYRDAEIAYLNIILPKTPQGKKDLDWAIGSIYKIYSAHINYYLDTYVPRS